MRRDQTTFPPQTSQFSKPVQLASYAQLQRRGCNDRRIVLSEKLSCYILHLCTFSSNKLYAYRCLLLGGPSRAAGRVPRGGQPAAGGPERRQRTEWRSLQGGHNPSTGRVPGPPAGGAPPGVAGPGSATSPFDQPQQTGRRPRFILRIRSDYRG